MTSRVVAMSLLVVLSFVGAHAQSDNSDPWFRRSARPKDFAVARLPWNTFSVELPKDWQVAPGYRGILLSSVENTRNNQPTSSIVIEQMKLEAPLTSEDIDGELAKLEADQARLNDPSGQDFQHHVKEVAGTRFVFVTYSRRGLNGMDSVVQYAIPNGNVLYRLVCIAPTAQLAQRYQAIFAHVAASFKPTPANAS